MVMVDPDACQCVGSKRGGGGSGQGKVTFLQFNPELTYLAQLLHLFSQSGLISMYSVGAYRHFQR